jgi:parallel beta-helix repeat protein
LVKEAVNNVNPGDTIEVYSGTYYEYGIEIHTENVTLKGIPYELGNGNDTGKPFINGEGKDLVIGYMMTEGVLVTGFRMENGDGSSHDIVNIYKSKNCIFSNNDINNTITALIFSQDSTNIQILHNNISHSLIRDGIAFLNCSYFTISDNIITDVKTGICVWDSNNNTITVNKIMNCREFGIDVAGSYNKIIGNHLENNNIGIQIWNFFNSVKRNNFINNDLHAQFIYGIPILQRLTNIWFGNYWDKPRLLPYPILGLLVLLPIIQFDWRPALKPYDIPS